MDEDEVRRVVQNLGELLSMHDEVNAVRGGRALQSKFVPGSPVTYLGHSFPPQIPTYA